jgi:hypothetical protein
LEIVSTEEDVKKTIDVIKEKAVKILFFKFAIHSPCTSIKE